ncbi:MAG: ATP phosphoribosyltransferase regulatory subunit [Burkholderiales bacterium]|nr:ATP phosphoribosyltransferase regulatory subunit [Burkholderiales bacterium]
MRNWLLPEAIADVLPAEAARVEALRRALLDHFERRGYRLVQPPLVEHLDSLLTGTGRDLDLLTFKTVDPLSGRMLGLRADTTPQVARIDAHLLNEPGVTRLCYAGSVLRTAAAPGDSRQVIQVGAELYGHADIAADRETMRLLVSALTAAGIAGLHLDLGHVGLYRALARAAGLDGSGEGDDAELFRALRDKDGPAVEALTGALPEPARGALRALATLYGPAMTTLAAARQALPALPDVAAALDALGALASAAEGVAAVHVDLADLRGYHYYTGATFSVFVQDASGAVTDCGRGGRYDGVGRAFGRARPATGFSMDLRHLASLAPPREGTSVIVAPDDPDPALAAAIAALRARGERVIVALPGEHGSGARRLQRDGTQWKVA